MPNEVARVSRDIKLLISNHEASLLLKWLRVIQTEEPTQGAWVLDTWESASLSGLIGALRKINREMKLTASIKG